MRSKKSQLAYVIDIVIIIAMIYVLVKGYQITNVQANIGANQLKYTRAFAEGEQIKEYMKGSMRLAIYEQFDRDGCSEDFVLNPERFEGRMEDYIESYESPYAFEVIFPDYVYSFEKGRNFFGIAGKTDENIIIKSKNLQYELDGNVGEAVTCENWQAFEGE